MNTKPTVAVLISGIDEEYQNSILRGIQKCAEEIGFNICNFICFGGMLSSVRHDKGEFNIFNLVNYAKFDGVILLTNTIPSDDAVEDILKQVERHNLPVVSIDYKLDNRDNHYYIGISNYDAMKVMAEHFIQIHGVRKLNFISGPQNNIDSILRLSAYKAALREAGIPYEPERVFQGNFRESDGKRAVEFFFDSENGLSDVEGIISANDNMLLSAVKELERRGYKIPQDIIVAGFDNISAGRNYPVEFTTVDRPLYKSGYMALMKIRDFLAGLAPEKETVLETTPKFAASCGCYQTPAHNIAEIKQISFDTIQAYKTGIPMVNKMAARLTESNTLEENLEHIKFFISEIGCEKCYLCLCDDWREKSPDSGVLRSYRSVGYSEKVTAVIAYCDGVFGYHDKFDSDIMLPEVFESDLGGNVYYFSPLHYQDRCLGYLVICNSPFPLNNPMFHSWLLNISNSVENIRKILSLEDYVQRLENLSITDNLGQIYNRNGFLKYAHEAYQDSAINTRHVMIMFLDMDGLKYINDHYGHKEGDIAIRAVCDVLKKCCIRGEICARFGGDEFVVFATDYSEDDAKSFCDRFVLGVDEYNSSSGKPYNVDASMGFTVFVPEPNVSLFTMISLADNKMYEEKKKKRHSKYLRRSDS